MQLPIVAYCSHCLETYETVVQAAACCGGPADLGYECPDCGLLYDEEAAAAVRCCNWDCTPLGYQARQAEMEAAGQLRLRV